MTLMLVYLANTNLGPDKMPGVFLGYSLELELVAGAFMKADCFVAQTAPAWK
jgi:hypothetical protein